MGVKTLSGRRRLTQVPPEPREMVAYYTAHSLCLGWGYLLFVGGPGIQVSSRYHSGGIYFASRIELRMDPFFLSINNAFFN